MSAEIELDQGRRLARGPAEPTPGSPAGGAGPGWRVAAPIVLIVVVAGAWWFTFRRAITPLPAAGEMLARLARFASDLAGVDATGPTVYAQSAEWARMGELALDTVVMSVLASGLAGAGALATVAFASRVLTVGEFASAPPAVGRTVFAVTRGAHVVARSVPEFVWALLLVFVLGPGLLTGALALALHELGVLGRLASDVVDDVDRGPLRALRSSGARTAQTFAYGVLPQVLPQLVTFLLYRWEVVIRATVVVGFVTAAGLGDQLRLDFSARDWTGVGLVLLTYVVLVFCAETVAAALRRLAR